MNIRRYLKRFTLLKTLYYWVKQKKEIAVIPKKEYERSQRTIKSYQGKYEGKRCFVIGNGPSLTVSDLQLLKNEYTFASNRIFTLYSKTDWRPTFYCIQDGDVLRNIMNDVPNAGRESLTAFISTKQYLQCSDAVKKMENICWIPMRAIPPHGNMYKFSTDITDNVVDGLTITYSCIQLAAYMGFSEIILLGVDHNYAIEIDADGNIIKRDESIQNHFKEAQVSYAKQNLNLPSVVEMTRAYISAEKQAQRSGFKIYNATRGGKLEVYERINLDTLF